MSEEPQKRKVLEIVKKRTIGGVLKYSCKVEGMPEGKFVWLTEDLIEDKQMIEDFNSKNNKPQKKEIKRIVGMTKDKQFKVEFEGEEKEEMVPNWVMRKKYHNQLLDFYEENLVFPSE